MKQSLKIVLFLLVPIISQAQFGGLANRIKNKAVQKTTQRIEKRADQGIDKALDEIEGKSPKKENQSGSTSTNKRKQEPTTVSFSKYDFVPGEKIIYAEDFSQDQIGELPIGWNTNGTAEVVTLENQEGRWLQIHKSFLYLTNNTKEFGENFTIEFDAILKLKNNGWGFPELSFGILTSGTLSTTDNSLLKDLSQFSSVTATILPGAASVSRLKLESKVEKTSYFVSQAKDYKELENYYGKPIHIAIQVQKERCRVWVNEVKAFDAPKAVPLEQKMNQLFFKLSHTNYAEADYGIFIGNIKLATGLPDTRHKLIEEGKFSTTGILFDVNAATIKPESAGVLAEIAAVLKENPSLKIKVVGHTSSDGDDKANMDLSKKRADAVKHALTKDYSIDALLIETDGKGEKEPVGDNKTKEGKIQNRRVEFTKI